MNVETIEGSTSVAHAREFITAAPLPEPPSQWQESESVDISLDSNKNQAIAVGPDVVSFAKGVDSERRSAITNSALLAQLVANHKVPGQANTEGWYDAYRDVLTNLGWVVETNNVQLQQTSGQGVEAHEAMIAAAYTLLGGVTSAFLIVKATLEALKKLGTEKSWIDLYDRAIEHSEVSRFQMTIVPDDSSGQCSMALMTFALEANASLTKVVFVKVKTSNATLKTLSCNATIDSALLDTLKDDVKRRVLPYLRQYVHTLPELGEPSPPAGTEKPAFAL